MHSRIRNPFTFSRRSLGIRGRIRTFLARMHLGSVDAGSPFWERLAAPAH
jgi:hypothetical protein